MRESTDSNSLVSIYFNNDINDDEEVSLIIKENIQSSKESGCVTFTDWMGGILTLGAMIPQGFLGVLITDAALQYLGVNNIYYRILPDGVMFLLTEEGKRQLVRFYNTETFKNLGRTQTWQNFFDRSQWTTPDYLTFPLDAAISLVPSATFAYITKLAFEGMSPFLSAYHTPVTDFLAAQVLNPWVQGPFMVASFIANLFGFFNIHKNTANLFKHGVLYFIENPQFRLMKEKLHLDMEATRLRIKALYEAGHIEEAQKILTTLQDKTVEALRGYLINHVPQDYVQKPESWIEFIHKNIMGFSLPAITLWGLLNFYQMGAGTASLLYLPILAPVLSVMASMSISALGFTSSYALGTSLIEWCYQRDVELNIFSRWRIAWILISTGLIALLGSTPNVYQSIFARENSLEEWLSLFASAIIETLGIYTLTKVTHIKRVTSQDDVAKEFYTWDTKLREISNLNEVSEEEIHALFYEKTPKATDLNINQNHSNPTVPSRYRSGFESVKNYLSHCLWGKSSSNRDTQKTPLLEEDKRNSNSCC